VNNIILNPNHPKLGAEITVEPIRTKKAITAIKSRLWQKKNKRDWCLFVLGINTAFRANELLSIRVQQVENAVIGSSLKVKQTKTDRYRTVTLNKSAIEAISVLLEQEQFEDKSEYLFQGQRGIITVPTLSRYVKNWCNSLKGNYASHTLRKTWGYWQYHQSQDRGVCLPLLMKAFGHSTQEQTLHYLCIQPQEIQNIYLTMEL
jgi:integrase